ncbi:MAG: DUF2267 domain-containing protein [Polyangiales bacterium]
MSVLEQPTVKAKEWIDEIADEIAVDEQTAWSCLRAGLHALRDRLPVDEAAHLAAQLPLIVRGLYFDGWRPAQVPVKMKTREDLMRRVTHELHGADIAPEMALRAVFHALDRHITHGQVATVQHTLPRDLQELWLGH